MKDYTSYIVAAYGFGAALIGFVTARILLDYRALKRKLARFGGQEDQQ